VKVRGAELMAAFLAVLPDLASLAPLEVENLALLGVQTIFIFLPVLAHLAFEISQYR
jgi:hypothetical protein